MSKLVQKIGWPIIIIGFFLIVLFILCPIVGVNIQYAVNNVIGRFAMNLVLVLSLVPMIQTGCGLNFGLPLGIASGIFGAACSIELTTTTFFGLVPAGSLKFLSTGFAGMFVAIIIGCSVAALVGLLYGSILNRIKGDEMIISTYTGFVFIAFTCLLWIKFLPFKNPLLIYAYGGDGFKPQVTLTQNWASVLDNLGHFKIGSVVTIPVGTILFGALCCFLIWLFFRSKLGTAMTAVGSNPEYAKASGVSVNKMRLISVVMSTAIAALGIIVYAQSYTFVQFYLTPNNYTLPTVAAILLGGAAIKKASIKNVLIGTFLFFGVITLGPQVAGETLADVAEPVRLIIQNGMILYALTRKERR
jgi:simple sugar transport system permease protein